MVAAATVLVLYLSCYVIDDGDDSKESELLSAHHYPTHTSLFALQYIHLRLVARYISNGHLATHRRKPKKTCYQSDLMPNNTCKAVETLHIGSSYLRLGC